MSKHLCGPACDLALAALGRAPPAARPPCCVATCCHYLCTWQHFSGRAFWLALGLDKQDFRVAVATSQWASLRSRPAPAHADPNDAARTDAGWLPDMWGLAAAASAKLRAPGATGPARTLVPSEEFERSFSREQKGALGRAHSPPAYRRP